MREIRRRVRRSAKRLIIKKEGCAVVLGSWGWADEVEGVGSEAESWRWTTSGGG